MTTFFFQMWHFLTKLQRIFITICGNISQGRSVSFRTLFWTTGSIVSQAWLQKKRLGELYYAKVRKDLHMEDHNERHVCSFIFRGASERVRGRGTEFTCRLETRKVNHHYNVGTFGNVFLVCSSSLI